MLEKIYTDNNLIYVSPPDTVSGGNNTIELNPPDGACVILIQNLSGNINTVRLAVGEGASGSRGFAFNIDSGVQRFDITYNTPISVWLAAGATLVYQWFRPVRRG